MIRTAVLALALVASSVFAQEAQQTATLVEATGEVRVNTGEQFGPGEIGQGLKAGDKVMAMDGATATITFQDGCEYKVESGTLVTVPEKSPCAGGIVQTQAINPAGTQAVGSATGTAGSNGGAYVAVGLGIAIIIGSLGEGDDDNASP